jgi:response regulator RpfG family c-di-GMP phosphodiesterase
MPNPDRRGAYSPGVHAHPNRTTPFLDRNSRSDGATLGMIPRDVLDFATVTVVDDEPHARDVLVRAARSWQYECQAAASAEHALRLLEERPTPIVVTDLRMPGRGGIWLVHEIQKRWPDVAVIVITAGHEDEAVEKCLAAGAHHYFLKPIQLDEFRHVLQGALRDYHARREKELQRRRLEREVRRRTRQARQTYLSAINSLVRTLEARDPYTCGHSLRVRTYALRLAELLFLDERRRRQLSLAAKLHDIGKVAVPEAILNKTGELTAEEFAVVRTHPEVGERILSPVIHSRTVLATIRGHHERYDGRGYPDGLAGEKIPLLARILAVADSFDAMISSRAYRGALPTAEAARIIRAGAGTQFDPALMAAFERFVAEL